MPITIHALASKCLRSLSLGLTLGLAIFASVEGLAQATATLPATPTIAPLPQAWQFGNGTLRIDPALGLRWSGKSANAEVVFMPFFDKLFGLKASPKGTSLVCKLSGTPKKMPAGFPDASYQLSVNAKGIQIMAPTEAGLLAGCQSLLQLISVPKTSGEALSIPYIEIQDAPRFAWRGMHLDVSRHFYPISFLKKYIDLLVLNKMNLFHWHLTDDQGWRIEIKKYPLLTQVGGWRKETRKWLGGSKLQDYDGRRHGGFYTQAEVKELVVYAAQRQVTILPEIELPGHVQALLAAYPQYGCTDQKLEVWTTWGVSKNIINPNQQSVDLFKDILAEVMPLFPSPYIHIGGDEAAKDQWIANPAIQQQIKTLGLKDEHELQSWFIKQIEQYVNNQGKQIIGWDEILEGGLAPNAAVMSWRGTAGGIAAAKAKHLVVMTPSQFVYFDHYQSDRKWEEPLAIGGNVSLEQVFSFDPAPDSLGAAINQYILGAQGNVWTEYIASEKHVEYMVNPRIIALSEVLWSGANKPKDFKAFKPRCTALFNRVKALGYEGRE